MTTPLKLLMVEDSEDDAILLLRELENSGFESDHQRVCNEEDFKTALKTEHWDLVISDFSMPGFTGIEALKIFREIDNGIPFILVTGAIGEDRAIEVMKAGADDCLLKDRLKRLGPAVKRALQEADNRRKRVQAGLDLEESYLKLQKAMEGAIGALSSTLEQRDPYTAGHQTRVSRLARAVGQRLGLEGNRPEGLFMGGLVHDLGKISIPSEILTKPSRLSKVEFDLIREHSIIGARIMQGIDFPWPVQRMILEHHERMDGSGYPDGKKGEEILLESRILGTADVVEAMASDRPYRAALGIDVALEEIRRGRGTQYDPDVADACLELFEKRGWSLQTED